jgi:hypothetical protein
METSLFFQMHLENRIAKRNVRNERNTQETGVRSIVGTRHEDVVFIPHDATVSCGVEHHVRRVVFIPQSNEEAGKGRTA